METLGDRREDGGWRGIWSGGWGGGGVVWGLMEVKRRKCEVRERAGQSSDVNCVTKGHELWDGITRRSMMSGERVG